MLINHSLLRVCKPSILMQRESEGNGPDGEELLKKLDGMITPPITLAERTDPELFELYYTSSHVRLLDTLILKGTYKK